MSPLLVLAALGCAPAPELLTDGQLSAALAVAEEVDTTRLTDDVAMLVEAHAADPGEVVSPWDRPHKRRGGEATLLATFAKLGVDFKIEDHSGEGWEVHNIVVEFPGATRPDEVVLVTAHYDVWYQGADDNSSGIAVLLELARALIGKQHARTIRIVAFDAEEVGLIGSARYFRRHPEDDVRLVINMDSVGFASSEAGSQVAPPGFTLPEVGDFIVLMANDVAAREALILGQLAGALPEPLALQGAVGSDDHRSPGTGDFHRSDHSQAWAQGTPGVFLTDTTNFRNEHYHTETDLPDTLDYGFLTQVGQLVVAGAWAMAEEAE
ncbi:MAG: M28 family peptidase [Deltaproteobacteria bacterium]|nr:M28 family peptidase [Deltaproteobacteria bacterium]